MMAGAGGGSEKQKTLAASHRLAGALVRLAGIDLPYSDLYWEAAESALSESWGRQRYQALKESERQLPVLLSALRAATERREWSAVKALAARAQEIRSQIQKEGALLQLGTAMYEPHRFQPDAAVLALHGAVPAPRRAIEDLRNTAIRELETAASLDPTRRDFYTQRLSHFRSLALNPEEASPDPLRLSQEITEAIDRGDLDRVERLATLAAGEENRHHRTSIPPVPAERREALARALPPAVEERARESGLIPFALPGDENSSGYLSCPCAERATMADQPISKAGADDQHSTCGHSCPPELPEKLRSNLDLLIARVFITSAGYRYLPWFGPEAVCVETFPEDADAGRANMPLLRALGLSRRQGLSRAQIEDALLRRGPALIRRLGLDPVEFVVCCIPFDLYLRLAPELGWGRQALWTHYDGYQVTRDGKLWPLVGGHVRYGGRLDLSIVGATYDSEILLARFAVLRRERHWVREGPDSGS